MALPNPARPAPMRLVEKLEAVPPHSPEIEAAALGAMMLDERAWHIAFEELRAEDFYIGRHQRLFNEFATMMPTNDEILIRNELRNRRALDDVGGSDVISRMIEAAGSAASIEEYCKALRKLGDKRIAQTAAAVITTALENNETDDPLGMTLEALEAWRRQTQPASDAVEQLRRQFQDEKDGIRYALEIPPFIEMCKTKCFLPGTVTVLCAKANTSKSLLINEIFWRATRMRIMTFSLALENGVVHLMRRILAQLAGSNKLMDDRYSREHPDEVDALFTEHEPVLQELKKYCYAMPVETLSCQKLLQWIRERGREGARLLLIDPVSMIEACANNEQQLKFLAALEPLAIEFKLSIVLVTHPKKMPGVIQPDLANVRLHGSFTNFVGVVLWLQGVELQPYGDQKYYADPKQSPKYNRTLTLLKLKNAPGQGRRIAYEMQPWNLMHHERGEL